MYDHLDALAFLLEELDEIGPNHAKLNGIIKEIVADCEAMNEAVEAYLKPGYMVGESRAPGLLPFPCLGSLPY